MKVDISKHFITQSWWRYRFARFAAFLYQNVNCEVRSKARRQIYQVLYCAIGTFTMIAMGKTYILFLVVFYFVFSVGKTNDVEEELL